jgi:hypothetical protein
MLNIRFEMTEERNRELLDRDTKIFANQREQCTEPQRLVKICQEY